MNERDGFGGRELQVVLGAVDEVGPDAGTVFPFLEWCPGSDPEGEQPDPSTIGIFGVTETPILGQTELWNLINLTPDAHPMHLHLVAFEVVERRQILDFDPQEDTIDPASLVNPDGSLQEDKFGPPVAPDSFELGPLDIVSTWEGYVTRIKAKFEKTGLYVWHCHILSHEDYEMMRPFVVVPDDPSRTLEELVLSTGYDYYKNCGLFDLRNEFGPDGFLHGVIV
ncbi:unnamed protein product [Chrysoparadoxa australica]